MPRSVPVLLLLLLLADCATAPDTTTRYAGKWIGMWRSTASPRAEGTIEAELRSVGGRLDGSVVFESTLGRFTLPIHQVEAKEHGPVMVTGEADAATGGLKARVEVTFELHGDRITGTYGFPALRDAGTLELHRK